MEGHGHVLLLPFMGQGHLIPFMALAKLLEQQTPHSITIVNTPLNIQRLRSFLHPKSTIRLAELPFNSSDHGLPPNIENTSSVPSHLSLLFVQASQSLQPAFHHLVSTMRDDGRSPLCIIADMLMSWSVETAKRFGVFHAIFQTSSAYSTADTLISLSTDLPMSDDDYDDEFSLLGFSDMKLRRSQIMDDTDPGLLFVRKCFFCCGQSDGILINTVEVMESKVLQYFRKNVWKRVWAVGPLLLPPFPSSSSSSTLSPTSVFIEWLNLQPPDSVLYISFGSENSINPSPMMELAKGLEACGKPFLWVIRPPNGFDLNGEFRAEWLPEGFEDRIRERKQGILVKKWAPQIEILTHKSTGAFLSHCGWNSILESLSQGVPIIGWPMRADQPFNSKLLEEELGVSVEMAKGCDAEIRGVDIGKVVGWVLDGKSEKGMEMRRKAKQMELLVKSAIAVEGSSVRAIEDFVQTALAGSAIP